MPSDHGWTMLKSTPNPTSQTCYYAHPGDLDTSDGDGSTVGTKIKLSNGLIPSHIKVDVVPNEKRVVARWPVVVLAFMLLSSYILLALVYGELKSTKVQLRALENMVKSLGSRNERQEIPSSYGAAEYRTAELKFGNAVHTTPSTISSTERDKRETVDQANQGFPLLAHYKGGLPESVISEGGSFRLKSFSPASDSEPTLDFEVSADVFDGDIGCPGLISPWFKDKSASGEFALTNTTFKEAKSSVVVPESGLYFIYSQVFYLTRNLSNSFSITMSHETGHETVLATCSSPPNDQGESSCYTATARALKKGDKLQLRQRERNRHILLRQGQTFLGLVLLSPSPSYR